MARILVCYYSLYGHIHQMAEAAAKGAAEVDGVTVDRRRVPETMSEEVLESMGALDAQKSMSNVPVIQLEELDNYDGIIFGTPTRYGNMIAQMSTFWDSTGSQWATGALVGKVGSVFTASATQHGGQETTIISFYTNLLHHGMVIVGLPYAWQGQMRIDEITGGSPYGAATIVGGQGQRMPSENELEGARFQGRHVAEVTKKLFG